MEQMEQFRYLSSLISENGYCEEIQSRIEIARKVFVDKRRFELRIKTELRNKERNYEVLGVEYGTICSRDMDSDERLKVTVEGF